MTDRTASLAAYWDAAAATFDSEPDHGMLAEDTRAAWARLLRSLLPTGVDLAPRMVERARAKSAPKT